MNDIAWNNYVYADDEWKAKICEWGKIFFNEEELESPQHWENKEKGVLRTSVVAEMFRQLNEQLFWSPHKIAHTIAKDMGILVPIGLIEELIEIRRGKN